MPYGSDNYGVTTRQTVLDATINGPAYVRTAADEAANEARCKAEQDAAYAEHARTGREIPFYLLKE